MLFTVVAAISVAQADVLCISKAGKSRVAGSCNANEKTFQGTPGPAGPAGAQGPAGPGGAQGAAGIGVTNANCAQQDISGVWRFNFLTVGGPMTGGDCFLSLDSSGNLLLGFPNNTAASWCSIYHGAAATPFPVTAGKISLVGSGSICGFNINYIIGDGSSWVGSVTVDRTRSNFSGLVSSNPAGASLITGVRLGAVNNGFNPRSMSANDSVSNYHNEALEGITTIYP